MGERAGSCRKLPAAGVWTLRRSVGVLVRPAAELELAGRDVTVLVEDGLIDTRAPRDLVPVAGLEGRSGGAWVIRRFWPGPFACIRDRLARPERAEPRAPRRAN